MFEDNSAQIDGGALNLLGLNLTCVVRNSSFSRNHATDLGGALNAVNVSRLEVLQSSFSENTCGLDAFERQPQASPQVSNTSQPLPM